MYMDSEEFCFLIKGISFCTPPQKNYQINSIILDKIMDQFDYLEDLQISETYTAFHHTLLIDRKVKVSDVLFLEIINQ